jgi:hypothetical protein
MHNTLSLLCLCRPQDAPPDVSEVPAALVPVDDIDIDSGGWGDAEISFQSPRVVSGAGPCETAPSASAEVDDDDEFFDARQLDPSPAPTCAPDGVDVIITTADSAVLREGVKRTLAGVTLNSNGLPMCEPITQVRQILI